MRRKSFDRMECGIARALELIGDPWTILIVREALFGTVSFEAFHRRLNIPRNTLSDRLAKLHETGVLSRRASTTDARRIEYHLEQPGEDLLVVLAALSQWGNKHVFGKDKAPSFIADRKTGRPIQDLALTNDAGRTLTRDDVTMIPGPAASQRLRKLFEQMKQT